jgi:hypothetical protein
MRWSLVLTVGRVEFTVAPAWTFSAWRCNPPCRGCGAWALRFGPFTLERT